MIVPAATGIEGVSALYVSEGLIDCIMYPETEKLSNGTITLKMSIIEVGSIEWERSRSSRKKK
jgi:hypothetical protein